MHGLGLGELVEGVTAGSPRARHTLGCQHAEFLDDLDVVDDYFS